MNPRPRATLMGMPSREAGQLVVRPLERLGNCGSEEGFFWRGGGVPNYYISVRTGRL